MPKSGFHVRSVAVSTLHIVPTIATINFVVIYIHLYSSAILIAKKKITIRTRKTSKSSTS